jgi:hypothetical protein
MPPPPPPDPATVAWGKVQVYADRLFEALDDLSEAGSSTRAAALGNWSVQALDRALGTLQAAREGLDAEIARLESRRRHFPRRRRIG